MIDNKKSIFIIDKNGKVLDVLKDDFNLFEKIIDNFISIVDKDNKLKFLKFLIDLNEKNIETTCEIALNLKNRIETYILIGLKIEDRIILFITKEPSEKKRIYKELLILNNEQINYFRKEIKKIEEERKNIYKNYLDSLEEISRLNNELINAQREIVKKTIELEKINESLKEMNIKLEKMAIIDQLTGLYNRWYLYEILQREIAKLKRYNLKLSLVSIDLNNFKLLNDTYGHLMGDKFLCDFAKLLLNKTRKNVDYIFRLGGDEFLIILIGSNKINAEKIMNRISESLKKLSNIVTLAYGIVEINSQDEIDINKLLTEADKLMYEHKKQVKEKLKS